MRILVTGACGFIGSHLVEKLVKQNYNVKAFTFYNARGSNGWLDNVDKKIINDLEIVSGDVRDQEFVLNNSKKIDIVFHLAALIGIPYSYHASKSYIDTNINGTYNILNAAKINNISKTIITSTSEVYGTAQTVPITEKHRLNAQSPYAASKTAADQLSLSFFNSFQVPLTIIRPFNTYGPRQSARAVIPTIITQIKGGKNTIKLGSTHTTRDFSYVEDTVEGLILASKPNIALGKTLNLDSNFEISVLETAELISNIMGIDLSIDLDNQRKRPKNSEVFRLFSSIHDFLYEPWCYSS